jgi:hypothetical protein
VSPVSNDRRGLKRPGVGRRQQRHVVSPVSNDRRGLKRVGGGGQAAGSVSPVSNDRRGLKHRLLNDGMATVHGDKVRFPRGFYAAKLENGSKTDLNSVSGPKNPLDFQCLTP